jgi:uncharacterized DUF497 family protein
MAGKWMEWDEAKNQRLKTERKLCFEDVQNAIEQGRVLDDKPHPDSVKRPNQRLLVVEINDYVCLVPYVTDGDTMFLKTIYPSRKADRTYSKEPK